MKKYMLVLALSVVLSACSKSKLEVEKIKENCRVSGMKMVISEGVGRVTIDTSCGSFTANQLTESESRDLSNSVFTGKTYDLFVVGKSLYQIRELPTVAL